MDKTSPSLKQRWFVATKKIWDLHDELKRVTFEISSLFAYSKTGKKALG